MSQLPLFTIFDLPPRLDLYAALRRCGPQRAWELMQELAEHDRPRYEAGLGPGQDVESLAARARSGMRSTPALAGRDLEQDATAFARYGPRLQLECTYLALWLGRRDDLDTVVEVVGAEHLRDALAVGRGVLALPFHVGPSYAVSPVLAHHVATTALYNRMNFDELAAAFFPDLPIEAHRLGDGAAFRRAVTALRAGRAFSMFPELDPRGVDRHHERVPFLGTTVLAPLGPALLSRSTGAPMLPLDLRRTGDGTFRLTFHPPVEAPRDAQEDLPAVRAVWSALEDVLLAGDVGEWEIWFEFDALLPAAPVPA
ncbi:lysophospholipid acyltransferase family protein [Cellulomonas sp.]|uniref:lysophospholipid acyltransferase family protein n=1 Tax=Cellulomonas sp. TaxID=40001 RepID=UPI002810E08B|nr:lysophospholipid acyltransferase family protein [Cellulomonas sp.]